MPELIEPPMGKEVNKKSGLKKAKVQESEKTFSKFKFGKYHFLALIMILTTIVYLPSLTNGFINFDDNDFILKNLLIRDFSLSGILNIFLSLDKHDPLTVLSHAITYKFWGINPFPYHIINLILHLLNVLLVFILILRITRDNLTSLLTSLFFAIHPLKAESICWISERKDVLYSFFFLLSLIFYISYISKGLKFKYLFFSFLFFIMSLLSKFSAVALPFILLLFDFYFKRKIDKKVILEKVVFLAFSLFLLVFHFFSMSSTNKVVDLESFLFIDKIFFCSYSFVYYIVHSVYFFGFSAINPYPFKHGSLLPTEYYASILVAMALIILILYILKKYSRYSREIVFGLLFFLVNISLVLHIVPVRGIVIVSERYTYLAFIGLFFIPSFLVPKISTTVNRKVGLGILGVFAVYCIVFTIPRIRVWKDGISYWENVKHFNPDFFLGYYGKGVAEYEKHDYQESKKDLDISVKLNPGYGLSYVYRGRTNTKLKNFDMAIADYSTAIIKDSNNSILFFERGNLFYQIGKTEPSIKDLTAAILLDNKNPSFYNNRGFVLTHKGRYKEAMKDLDKAIDMDPLYSEALNNRANLKLLIKDYKGAITDLEYTISLKPGIPELFISKARADLLINDPKGAISDCMKGLSIDPGNSTLYVVLGIAELQSENAMDACNQFRKASSLGNAQADSLLRIYCKH